MFPKFLLSVVCLFCVLAAAQEESSWDFNFDDYAVSNVFQGTPARPHIMEKQHLEFRTAITEAAAKGANFAGHFTIAQWDCGSDCLSLVIIDETNGKLFPAPFKVLTTPAVEGTEDDPAHEFKGAVFELKSRLLIIDGCPEEKKCATYYYEWKDEQLKQLSMVPQRGPSTPAPSDEQNGAADESQPPR
jgi:hypothetical protein